MKTLSHDSRGPIRYSIGAPPEYESTTLSLAVSLGTPFPKGALSVTLSVFLLEMNVRIVTGNEVPENRSCFPLHKQYIGIYKLIMYKCMHNFR
jgi:hypothetical protein